MAKFKELQRLKELIPSKLKSIIVIGVLFFLIIIGFHPTQMKLLNSNFFCPKLVLPAKEFLLDRICLMRQIENNFGHQMPGIQIVTLAGMAGSGKTTMARIYGNKKKFGVVWEINAETKDSLINSFNDLAFVLATTKEQKREWLLMQKIQDANIRSIEIIRFVSHLLKESPNWLLIYDNVEHFMEIKEYLPQDLEIWGNGKVILTTCDLNIYNNQSKNVFVLGELNSNEMLELFCKVVYKKKLSQLTSSQKEEALKFLKHIPPFPLDVASAAYYIKNNKFNYEQYLEKIAEFNQHFENSQQALLKEGSGYEKTRNGVVMSSLEKIIDTNQEFKELLLLICLIDSQNIPKKLLESCKSPEVVEAFIHELKQYSLITDEAEPSSKQLHSFSIHRSTQSIGFNYLTKIKLKLEQDNDCMELVSQSAMKYIAQVIEHGVVLEQGDLSKMQPLLNHYKKLLSHAGLLKQEVIQHIRTQLGLILFSLSCYEDAKTQLENTLDASGAICSQNSSQVANILVHLGLSYKELGNYEKAQAALEKGLVIYQEYQANDNVTIARALTYLGTVYRELGNFAKANEVFNQSLVIYGKNLPEYNTRYAWSLGLIGITHIDTGNYQEAKKSLEESIAIYQGLPIENIRLYRYLGALGILYELLGEYEKARDLLLQSVNGYKDREYGEENYVALYLTHLGHVYKLLSDNKKANEFLDEGINICEKRLPKKYNLKARSQAYLGAFYSYIGKHDEAIYLLEKALMIFQQHYGKTHIETASILKMLGQAYLGKGEIEKSGAILNSALQIATQSNHPEVYSYLEALAETYLKKYSKSKVDHLKKQAIRYLEQALETIKTHFSENSIHYDRIKTKLGSIR